MPDHISELLAHLPGALLVVFRISGLMIFGPIFGSSMVPPRIKIGLAVVLGLAVYPLVGIDAAGGPRADLHLNLWTLAPVAAMELMIGLIIGFVASLPLAAVQIGGVVMGQQMGLGFARFYNPAIDDDADVLGQILFFMVLAAFLMIGGHESMVLALLHTFQHIPVPAVASFAPDAGLVSFLVGLLASATELALRVAAPLLALIFLETLAMGFIAKTVPQVNILTLGFPLRIICGLGIVIAGLVVIDDVMMDGMNDMLELLFAWIENR